MGFVRFSTKLNWVIWDHQNFLCPSSLWVSRNHRPQHVVILTAVIYYRKGIPNKISQGKSCIGQSLEKSRCKILRIFSYHQNLLLQKRHLIPPAVSYDKIIELSVRKYWQGPEVQGLYHGHRASSVSHMLNFQTFKSKANTQYIQCSSYTWDKVDSSYQFCISVGKCLPLPSRMSAKCYPCKDNSSRDTSFRPTCELVSE